MINKHDTWRGFFIMLAKQRYIHRYLRMSLSHARCDLLEVVNICAYMKKYVICMEIARWATIVQSRLCQYNAHGGRSREKLIICILHKKNAKVVSQPLSCHWLHDANSSYEWQTIFLYINENRHIELSDNLKRPRQHFFYHFQWLLFLLRPALKYGPIHVLLNP